MLFTRLYLYDKKKESSGYRGEEYSAYVLQGDTYKEDITQQVDSNELTLAGIEKKERFAPGTKFVRDDVYEIDGEETIYSTQHLCVVNDTVSKPILSDDTYYDHNITFYEVSVVGQKRLCDNISATYQLKDVSLTTKAAFDLSKGISAVNTKSEFTPANNWGYTSKGNTFRFGKYFEFLGTIEMKTQSGTIPTPTKYYRNVSAFGSAGNYKAKFSIPSLAINYGTNETASFQKIGNASIDWTIEQYSVVDSTTPEKTWRGTVHSNSDLSYAAYAWFGAVVDNPYKYESLPNTIKKEWILERTVYAAAYIKRYTDITAAAPVYETDTIDIVPDKVYKVSVSLHNYEDNAPVWVENNSLIVETIPQDGNPIKSETRRPAAMTSSVYFPELSDVSFTSQELVYSTQFQTYSEESKEILFQSATPFSAMALISKACLNSGEYNKVGGVFCLDINARQDNSADGKLLSECPFYVDPEFVDELNTTPVIENFYNQKNLWEILCEVGYYIHAVPEIRFGEDDRFMITFNRLGRTEQKTDNGDKLSVVNFSGIEDYIASCSSYVSNMVQLGGSIEEWVGAKTSKEQPLVYNDTCSIIVSKPIIELLEISVKTIKSLTLAVGSYTKTFSPGDSADMTAFVFERNIYNCLDVSYTVEPNKGYSLYYDLGKNEIGGCDYRSPTVNSGDIQNDYAIKKAIFTAFWGSYVANPTGKAWSALRVNDFVFHVKYRTKDSVRQNQSRPDLRKYLVASKYDKYPQAWQFNNQQDTLVDSEKFGNMIFGKLIRTGNLTYRITEWHADDDYRNLKHKGELYKINDELYYVATVSHTKYSSCIVSTIEYSKDYNQLSPIIGIPSEPRFYEISEQSQISRDVAINDFLLLTTSWLVNIRKDNLIIKDIEHIKDVLFGGASGLNYAKYAVVALKGDKDNGATGNQFAGQADFYKEVILPVNAYSSQNTLTLSWDMVDNFSAGNKLLEQKYNEKESADTAYRAMQAVQYTDTFGRAMLFDFFLLEDEPNFSSDDILDLPNSPITAKFNSNTATMVSSEDMKFTITNVSESMYIGEIVVYQNRYKATVTEISAPNAIITADSALSQAAFAGIAAESTFSYLSVSKGKTAVTEANILSSNVMDYYDTNYNGRGKILLKDCRESLSFDYNLQMITDSDRFVLSPFLFAPDKKSVKAVLLSEEVNKLSYGYISDTSIIKPKNEKGEQFTSGLFDIPITQNGQYIKIDIFSTFENVSENHFSDEPVPGYTQAKAVAIVYDTIDSSTDNPNVPFTAGKTKFIIARNIAGGDDFGTFDWYIAQPKFEDIFSKRQ